MANSVQPYRLLACQVPLSTGFSRLEYWSGLLHPSPQDPPNPGIEPASLKSPALADRLFTSSATWEAPSMRLTMEFLWMLFRRMRKCPFTPNLMTVFIKEVLTAHFHSTYTKIRTIQRRFTWALSKDDTQICEAFHIFNEYTTQSNL